MFRFSADQQHALRHGLQDFGKLTLAVMFLSSSLGLMQMKSAPDQPKRGFHQPACKTQTFNGAHAKSLPLHAEAAPVRAL
jgi:hypothetical protein